MSKSNQYVDASPPAYAETTSGTRRFQPSEKQRLPLQARLSETRSRRIQDVLEAYIEPLLEGQGFEGVSRKTFLLVPSDVFTHSTNLTEKDLVGISTGANATVVRLHSSDNSMIFWQQSHVLEELVASLQARLDASGHNVRRPDAQNVAVVTPSPSAPLPQQSFFSRRSISGPEHDPTRSTGHWKGGWRSDAEKVQKEHPLGLDELGIKASLKDVSFRTETEMGLLTTETAKAVWLEIEVGT